MSDSDLPRLDESRREAKLAASDGDGMPDRRVAAAGADMREVKATLGRI